MKVLTFKATGFKFTMRFGVLRQLFSSFMQMSREINVSINVPWDQEAFRTFFEVLYCPDVDITR